MTRLTCDYGPTYGLVMASKPRVSYAGAIQHVAVNGNNRQPMFLTDADRRHCLSCWASPPFATAGRSCRTA